MSIPQEAYNGGAVSGRIDAYRGVIDLYHVRNALRVAPDKETALVGCNGVYFPVKVDAYRACLVPAVAKPITLLNELGHLEDVALHVFSGIRRGQEPPSVADNVDIARAPPRVSVSAAANF